MWRPIRAPSLLGLLGAFLLAVPPATTESAGDASQRGAYCRLPQPGLKPVCLDPAQARYGDFFAAIEGGGDVAAASSQLEADLASDGAESYLALSSLSYGYWRLALRAAQMETVDPATARRLESWNALLSVMYGQRDGDPRFRLAVREAVEDLELRTATPSYAPAEGMLARLDRLDDQLGMRGAIRRMLDRVFVGEEE